MITSFRGGLFKLMDSPLLLLLLFNMSNSVVGFKMTLQAMRHHFYWKGGNVTNRYSDCAS